MEYIEAYIQKLEKKSGKLNSQVENILGDTILLAASIVYLGPFAPEDRMGMR
jgi:hypothetical protein